jgi:hypothetical protein
MFTYVSEETTDSVFWVADRTKQQGGEKSSLYM